MKQFFHGFLNQADDRDKVPFAVLLQFAYVLDTLYVELTPICIDR